jgi:hypothetical protein
MIVISKILDLIVSETIRINATKSKRGLKTLVAIRESFDKFVNRIKKQQKKENDKNIATLEKILDKFDTPQAKEQLVKYGYPENTTKERLQDDISLLRVVNVYPMEVQIEDLQANVAKFVMKQLAKPEIIVSGPSLSSTMEEERARERAIKIKEIDTIEPLPLFILLGFIQDPKLRKELQISLNLDEHLFPKSYTMFENFNEVVLKTKLTGQYNEYNIVQSDISKTFKQLDDKVQSNVVLSNFTKIPTKALIEANHKIQDLNKLFLILRDFGSTKQKTKDYSQTLIGAFITIYHDLLKSITDIQGKRVYSEYILRSLDILEIRRQIYSQDLLKLIESQATLSRDVSHSVADMSGIDNQENYSESMTNPANTQDTGHYNERFETEEPTDNDFFDDDELIASFL